MNLVFLEKIYFHDSFLRFLERQVVVLVVYNLYIVEESRII